MGNLQTFTEKDSASPTAALAANVTSISDNNEILSYTLTPKVGTPFTYNFSYLKNGLLKSLGVDGQNYAFSYDEAGRLSSRLNHNKIEEQFVYNEAGQAVESKADLITTNTTGSDTETSMTRKWSTQYSYDDDGRIKVITGLMPSGYEATYTYNNATEKLNRLTKAEITKGTDTTYVYDYSYDPAGNILTNKATKNGQVISSQTLAYDADNTIKDNPDYIYDVRGNLIKAKLNSTVYNYVYDQANRLTEVRDVNNSQVAGYTYDADGLRLSKKVGGTETRYHSFNGQLMFETQNDVITAQYVRSSTGKLLAVKLNNAYYYYHYNAAGDVTSVTNSSGNVFRQYLYDPYGNVISLLDGNGNPVLANGQPITNNLQDDPGFNHAYTYKGDRYDSESGLYFLNSRYYAAGIGSFLTKDRVLGDNGNPKTLNPYTYAQNDPLNMVDPSGNNAFAIGGLFSFGLATSGLGIGEVILIEGLLYLGYKLLTSSPNDNSSVTSNSETPTYQSGDVVTGRIPDTGPPNGYLDLEHP